MTAEIGGVTSAPIGASSTVIEPTASTMAPTSLVNLVANVPGVSENGQGGLFQVFSIRGVSRQRVTSLISGMRITSERRAGVSTSFVDPLLMGSVEVMRGPSTTFYGSGALGGVVQVFPRNYDGWSLDAGYDTDGDEHYKVVGTGGSNWSAGLAHRKSSDGEGATGVKLNTHFETVSAVLRYGWQRGNLEYSLLAIPTYADTIGKANTDFDNGRVTEYPRERHGLVKFAINSSQGWSLNSFVHAQDLQTRVVDQPGDQLSVVSNNTVDFGVRFERETLKGQDWTLRYGVDGFGRDDVDAFETRTPLSGGPTSSFSTLNGAQELETGFFGSARLARGKNVGEAGARFSYQGQENGADIERDRQSWNGYLGYSRQLTDRLKLRAGASTGLRFPSLSELFFTGTTGAGEVFGNEQLEEERSFNTEVSLAWQGTRVMLNGVVFNNRIDDYIERIDDPMTDQRTFLNLTSGTLRGVELQGLLIPSPNWLFTWGGHMIEGRDSDDNPLADVAVDSVYAGFGHRLDAWDFDARLELRNGKGDPGSGENAIGSAELLSASVAYDVSPGWRVALRGSNLFDETYHRSADRKDTLAAGRSFSIHLIRRGH